MGAVPSGTGVKRHTPSKVGVNQPLGVRNMKTRTYSREDVETHYGPDRPAVNVKDYADRLRAMDRHFAGYSDESRERVYQFAWDSAVTDFWETWGTRGKPLQASDSDGRFYFGGRRVTINADGRQGGWLVVEGLPSIDEWTAPDLGMWRRFERDVKASAADLQSAEWHIDMIEMNEWFTDDDRNCPECDGTLGAHEPDCEYPSDQALFTASRAFGLAETL